MLLSCDLVLTGAEIPPGAAEKIQAIHELANTIRARLEASERN
jgi:hypothetical protein